MPRLPKSNTPSHSFLPCAHELCIVYDRQLEFVRRMSLRAILEIRALPLLPSLSHGCGSVDYFRRRGSFWAGKRMAGLATVGRASWTWLHYILDDDRKPSEQGQMQERPSRTMYSSKKDIMCLRCPPRSGTSTFHLLCSCLKRHLPLRVCVCPKFILTSFEASFDTPSSPHRY